MKISTLKKTEAFLSVFIFIDVINEQLRVHFKQLTEYLTEGLNLATEIQAHKKDEL